ncbi:hypothetical protein RDI58_015402 [Solanum bulbocastanum]|uniref:Uncharacterized protein n=1 Tax=Solanum bulbocastanum TaxID=147425 RepID=A0AAN8TKU6_SOLBU
MRKLLGILDGWCC